MQLSPRGPPGSARAGPKQGAEPERRWGGESHYWTGERDRGVFVWEPAGSGASEPDLDNRTSASGGPSHISGTFILWPRPYREIKGQT